MNNIICSMLKHPFATSFIITATTNGIANIINEARGKEIKPIVAISFDKANNKKEK